MPTSYGKYLRWDPTTDGIHVMSDTQIKRALYGFRCWYAQKLYGSDGVSSTSADFFGRIMNSNASHARGLAFTGDSGQFNSSGIPDTKNTQAFNTSATAFPVAPAMGISTTNYPWYQRQYSNSNSGSNGSIYQRFAFAPYPSPYISSKYTSDGDKKGHLMMDSATHDLHKGTADSLISYGGIAGSHYQRQELNRMMQLNKQEMISGDMVGTYFVVPSSNPFAHLPGDSSEFAVASNNFYTDSFYNGTTETYHLYIKIRDAGTEAHLNMTSNGGEISTSASARAAVNQYRPLMLGQSIAGGGGEVYGQGDTYASFWQSKITHRNTNMTGTVDPFMHYYFENLLFFNYVYFNIASNSNMSTYSSNNRPTMGYYVYKDGQVPSGYTVRNTFTDSRSSASGTLSNQFVNADDYRTFRTPSGSAVTRETYKFCILDTANGT